MNGIVEVSSACSRVLVSRIEAQFNSFSLIFSIFAYPQATPEVTAKQTPEVTIFRLMILSGFIGLAYSKWRDTSISMAQVELPTEASPKCGPLYRPNGESVIICRGVIRRCVVFIRVDTLRDTPVGSSYTVGGL